MKNYAIEEFMDHLFGKEPVPGGGGASALAGAAGMALGGMVTNYTIGKKKYKEQEPEIIRLQGILKEKMLYMEELMQKDADAFEPLSKAYALPKSTPEEREYKEEVMEEALLEACEPPMEILRAAHSAIKIFEYLEEYGSTMVVSDVGVGISMLRAAMSGAILNVRINTKSMQDEDTAMGLEEEALRLLDDGVARADRLYDKIFERLGE